MMKEAKKTPAKRASTKPAAARKPAAAKVGTPARKKSELNPEERYRMIQEAAYYIAERHGFNGDSAYFWSQAEAEITARYS